MRGKLVMTCILFYISQTFPYNIIGSNDLNPSRFKKDDDKSSLVFVFDTTGSMYNDLRQLREGAELILSTALEESNVIADFAFVPFHDPAVGPATVTRDKQVFKAALNIVRVYGGGDCPEKSLGGIQLALNVSRPRSFIYVFTDATASDHRLVGKVLDSIQRKQSQVVFVLTGHCNDLNKPSFKVYQQIATASSGQVFNLNKTSVHKVLDFVRSSIKGRSVNLASAINPPGYNYTKEVPVDTSVGEVTVSVSGSLPQIHVVNPSGTELTGPPQLVTTLDLSEIMIVKVLNPEPGNWSITVGSQDEHSVRVVGLSDVSFEHGFSIAPPASMLETSYRPLQGTYNHLLVSLTGTEVPLRIKHAEILNLRGEILFEVALKETANGTYRADAFIPPEDFFYIAINGVDEVGKEFRRVGSTGIQAKPPDVPYLSAPKKIEARAHERVVLTCYAESLVPLTLSWSRDSAQVQRRLSSLHSTSLDYVIDDMGEGDVDTYHCVSKNAAGVNSVTTTVELIVDRPQVTITTTKATLMEHEDLVLTCSVFSESPLLSAQLEFHGEQKKQVRKFLTAPSVDCIYTFNETITSVTDVDSGIYTCVAVNRGGETNQSLDITVENKPSAQILGPHSCSKSKYSNVQVVCHVENAAKVHWLSPDGDVVKSEDVNRSLNAILNIENVTTDGIWTCVASREPYKASDAVKVSVLMKPLVSIEGPKHLTIVNGTMLELACVVVAKPAPRILWHMETERFLGNTVTVVEPNVYRSILTLNSSVENVRATFFCVGENSEGIHQDSVSVDVRREMKVVKGFSDTLSELYSKVQLFCVIESFPAPNVTWYHNGTIVQSDGNVNLAEDHSALHIAKVNFGDLGSYSCVASNGYENISITGKLDVEGLEAPLISKGPLDVVLKAGGAANMTCRIIRGKPEPYITWRYRNSTYFTDLPKNVKQNEDSIAFMSISSESAGQYRCIAENVLGRDEYDVNIDVQYPPQAKLDKSDSEGSILLPVKAGTVLSCKIHANPTPIVVWTKDKRPIAYSDRMYLASNGDLVLADVTEQESGLFTCTATNPLGSVHKNFSVQVFKVPVIIVSGSDVEVEVLEGQLVELPCTAEGVPPPRISWLHDGRDMFMSSRKRIDEYGLRFVANLTDFGNYSCVTRNEYGSAALNYSVRVWVPPSIKGLVDELITTQAGANISFSCDAVGFPIPKVVWVFEDQVLEKNSSSLAFDDNGHFFLYNISVSASGTYACVVENQVGVAQKLFRVMVAEPPKFISEGYEGPLVATEADSELTLSCRADGTPRPYVYWIKDGYYLDNDARYEVDFYGTLTIKRPTMDLSGPYTCLAKNAAGNITTDIMVEIYPLPAQIQADESPTVIAALEGSAVNITCPLYRDTGTVKWYKDASLIFNGTLRISNVTRANASDYACVVSTAGGSSYARVTLDVQWPPRFVVEEQEQVEVIVGNDCYFDCRTDSKPPARTKWLFNSVPILGEDKSKLKLLNVQLSQAGAYRCVARSDLGTIYRQYTLLVLEPPHISPWDELDVQLRTGASAAIECAARGFPQPTVAWKFNNTQWSVQDSKLLAKNVTRAAEGWFRCEASNRAGATHVVYHVTVVAAATVTDLLLFFDGQPHGVDTNVEIVAGSHARIACKASGNPAPSIRWLRRGLTVSVSAADVGYADLTLNSAGAAQAGEYHCVAVNEVGQARRTIRVNVLEKPKIFQSLFDNTNTSENVINLEVLFGQAFFMHCHPFGHPIPEVYWFKDGLPLHLYDDSMTSSDFSEVIYANSARKEQSGNYTCVARNDIGEDAMVYLVDVLVAPPKQKGEPISVKQTIGKSLNLTCPVEGTPVPYVRWMKLPYEEITESLRIQLLNDNFTLIINDTLVSDSGKYSCILTNKAGTTEVGFVVTIERAPTIAGNSGGDVVETHHVPLGRSLILKCEADGNPAPKINWLKDIQPLGSQFGNVEDVVGGSVLAVWSATVRHAGLVTCVAQNSAGLAHRRYNIIVKVPGKWSGWSQWGFCNVTCGPGYQQRSRACQYVDEDDHVIDADNHSINVVLDELTCKGSKQDKRKCQMPACESVAGGGRWSVWSRWSACSATCGAGTQTRARRCRRPPCAPHDNLQIRKCPALPKCERMPRRNDAFSSAEDYQNPEYPPASTLEAQLEHQGVFDFNDMDYYVEATVSPQPVYYDVDVRVYSGGSEPGACKPGYRHDNATNTCTDIDECLMDKNQCHATQVCINTAGGYRCGCAAGYAALGAGQRCLDINECQQGADGCEWACVNVAGGFVCACPPHLRLQRDRRSCLPPSAYSETLLEDLEVGDYLSTFMDIPTRLDKGDNVFNN